MRGFLLELRAEGYFKGLWREEAYPVTWQFTQAPLMAMERAAVPWFGVRAFGPHMTGYVRRKDGLHIWVPRRSYSQAHLSRAARQHGGWRPAGRHRPA